MNIKYAFHPEEYEVGQNEKYYADMARKGWFLKKRGAYLSRFEKGQPENVKYRIEFSVCSPLEGGPGLPEDQIALYEECGWTYVTSVGYVNVFCAPENSDAPEFYTDPKQQAFTLKALRRSYRFSWIPIVLVLLMYFIIGASISGSLEETLRDWDTEIRIAWVRATQVSLLWAVLLLQVIYQLGRGAVCTALLYRKLKRGQPIDHSPSRRPVFHRAVQYTLRGLICVLLLLTVLLFVGMEEYAMPEQADGPYLTLADLGVQAERGTDILGNSSTVQTARSLAAEQWDAREFAQDALGKDVWMYQDVYRMHTPAQALRFARVLMEDSTFARSAQSFKSLSIEGLDAAWCAALESVAVRGSTVWYITYSGGYEEAQRLVPLNTLAQMEWKVVQ